MNENDKDKDCIEIPRELLEITIDLSSTLDIDLLLERINRTAGSLVSAMVCSILLYDDQKKHLYFKQASGEKASILRRIQFNNGLVWKAAQAGKPMITDSSNPDFTGGIDKLTGFVSKTFLIVPVILEGEVIGALEAINKIGAEQFSERDKELFMMLASQIAILIRNARMAGDQRNFFTNTIEILVRAIESIGVVMGIMSEGHCWRVAQLSTRIGREKGVEGDAFDDLYYGAALHDIGILGLRKEVIKGLSDSDYELSDFEGDIKGHPMIGSEMVRKIALLKGTMPIIRYHHERFDGTGYPDGLKGYTIPLLARIVAVVEAYEEIVMCATGAGVEPKSLAVSELQQSAGSILDPELVEIFVKTLYTE